MPKRGTDPQPRPVIYVGTFAHDRRSHCVLRQKGLILNSGKTTFDTVVTVLAVTAAGVLVLSAAVSLWALVAAVTVAAVWQLLAAAGGHTELDGATPVSLVEVDGVAFQVLRAQRPAECTVVPWQRKIVVAASDERTFTALLTWQLGCLRDVATRRPATVASWLVPACYAALTAAVVASPFPLSLLALLAGVLAGVVGALTAAGWSGDERNCVHVGKLLGVAAAASVAAGAVGLLAAACLALLDLLAAFAQRENCLAGDRFAQSEQLGDVLAATLPDGNGSLSWLAPSPSPSDRREALAS